ncbi:hypothetical protein Pcinc_039101 [Petrolisthes cinctipes]|uniref:Uncharacterized protein n=1 Tax=Petrolisthes cinctipes TaxID=88211 RepID=A0AAE1BRZ6_PETCI|nr:hypothetical protein Pcinc_039101 [Petrolisthes cinctipes]
MQLCEKQKNTSLVIEDSGNTRENQCTPSLALATEDQAVKVDQHLSTVKCLLRRPNKKPTTMYNPGFDDSESTNNTTTERKSTMLGATAVPSTSGQPTPPQTSTTFRANVSTTTTAAVTSSTYSAADYYCHEGLTITKNIIRFKNVKIISNNTYMSNNETTRPDIKAHNNAEDTQAQNSTGHRRKLFGKKPVFKVGDTVINSTTPLSIPRSTTPPHCISTPHKDHIKLNPGTSKYHQNLGSTRTTTTHKHAAAWSSQMAKLRHTSEIAQHAARAEKMAEERRREKLTTILHLDRTIEKTRHAFHVTKRFLYPRRLLKYFRKKRIMAQWERLQESRRSLDSLSVKELVDLKFMLEERLRSFEESSSSVTSSVPSTQSL